MVKKLAAIYTRVAPEDQKTDTALKELRQYCRRMDWDIAEFKEKPHFIKERPVLDVLMYNARLKKFDVVVVWKLDRFAQSIRHLIDTVTELDSLGVRLISIKDGIDTDRQSPTGPLLLQLMASFAELEQSTMGERIRAGVAEAKRQGKHCGRPARVVPIGDAVKLRKKGWSLRQIANELELPLTTLSTALRGVPRKAPAKGSKKK